MCDVHSWATRKGKSLATARFFADWLKRYGLTEEQLADYRGNHLRKIKGSTILQATRTDGSGPEIWSIRFKAAKLFLRIGAPLTPILSSDPATPLVAGPWRRHGGQGHEMATSRQPLTAGGGKGQQRKLYGVDAITGRACSGRSPAYPGTRCTPSGRWMDPWDGNCIRCSAGPAPSSRAKRNRASSTAGRPRCPV